MTSRGNHIRPALRQAKIADLVARRGTVTVDALAAKFQSSAETIRRDLGVLADAGTLRKIHGGARAVSDTPHKTEGAFGARMRRNGLAKRQIAEKLAQIITPRQTIFIDTGSTTLICADALARIRGLTVITNSTAIAATLAQGSGGAEIYLLGGQYRSDNAQTVGDTAIAEIGRYRADMAILTVGAIDAGGVMDFSNHEAQIARAMIAASHKVTIVADHSKFNRSAAFSVCGLPAVDRLICDQTPDPDLGAALKSAGIEVQ